MGKKYEESTIIVGHYGGGCSTSLHQNGKVIRGSWTENGRPLDWGLPEELPPGLLDENWNMLRLTVRGVDAPNERFRAQVGAIGTVIFVR